MIVFILIVLLVSASMGWSLEYLERRRRQKEDADDIEERNVLEKNLKTAKEARDDYKKRCTENDIRISELEDQLKAAKEASVELGVYALKIHSPGLKQPHRFVLRSNGNHKPVATSELYHNERDVTDTLKLFPGIKVKES